MKKRDEQIANLVKENENLKAAESKKSRAEQIAAKAKSLNIPDFLMENFSIADDADIDKVLTEFAQKLVNNKLMPKDTALELSGTEEAMKNEAKSWAESLPDNDCLTSKKIKQWLSNLRNRPFQAKPLSFGVGNAKSCLAVSSLNRHSLSGLYCVGVFLFR